MNSYTICLYVEERVRGNMVGDWQNKTPGNSWSMPITRFNKSRVHILSKVSYPKYAIQLSSFHQIKNI